MRLLRITLPIAMLCQMSVLAPVSIASADPLKFPAGPEGAARFGAYYTQLRYGSDWDKAWRVGPRADVVVGFDGFDARLIFWRGTNYVPCWVNNNRKWYSDGGVARQNGDVRGDKLCRYSHVTVVENTDARVVIHWKYAPVDASGALLNADPMTNWNDWVDEFYTIYPDGVGVRRMKLFSSVWDQPVLLQESTVINEPGTAPQDNVSLSAVTLANQSGESRTSSWEASWPSALSAPADASIQIVNLAGKDGMKPFQAVFPALVKIAPIPKAEGSTKLNVDSGWPLEGTTDPVYDRPSSTGISRMSWAPCGEQWQRKSWMMMVGLTRGGPAEVATVARSWIKAPRLSVESGPYASPGYNAGDRAYELVCNNPGKPAPLKITLTGSEASPVFNPALAIKGWGKADASLRMDGVSVNRGPGFRYGYRKTLGAGDLIVWVEKQSTRPVTLEIEPLQAGKDGVQ